MFQKGLQLKMWSAVFVWTRDSKTTQPRYGSSYPAKSSMVHNERESIPLGETKMISLKDLDDLAIYSPSKISNGDLGEFRKLLRKCAGDFLKDPSQEEKLLREIELATYLDNLRKEVMRQTLQRIKKEAEATQKWGW
jgi:hypothetical protein